MSGPDAAGAGPRPGGVDARRIEIIAASAGSGKTTRIAALLESELAQGRVRPEGVLATTFTRRAAAELEERARSCLLAAGRAEDADRLAGARIGTVNAVAGRLVAELAFDLGLSPELRVLDEEAAAEVLRASLAGVITPAEHDELADIRSRMTDLAWPELVRDAIALARANGIDAAGLDACVAPSLEGVRGLLGAPVPDGAPLEDGLRRALERFLAAASAAPDGRKNTADAKAQAEQARARLASGRPLPWKDWVKLARLKPAAHLLDAAREVHEAAALHDAHPRLGRDVARAVELVLGISARGLAAYQQEKRARGAIDFGDQEALALAVLRGSAAARERLAAELDLVLVDEFQDTSPIELAIFLELASLARRSVWVGDQKQAIYGFRGTDPALMDAAIAGILGGAEPEALPRSHRSRPELVRLTSDLFTRAFAGDELPEARVRLEPALEREPPGLGPVLERWPLAARRVEDEVAACAAGVRALLGDASVRVRDRATGAPRPLRPDDVAILCRRNEVCLALARELAALGIPAVLARRGLPLDARGVARPRGAPPPHRPRGPARPGRGRAPRGHARRRRRLARGRTRGGRRRGGRSSPAAPLFRVRDRRPPLRLPRGEPRGRPPRGARRRPRGGQRPRGLPLVG